MSVYLYEEDSCLRSLESSQNSEVVVYNICLSRGSCNVEYYLTYKHIKVPDIRVLCTNIHDYCNNYTIYHKHTYEILQLKKAYIVKLSSYWSRSLM